jgi:hypothetical protein
MIKKSLILLLVSIASFSCKRSPPDPITPPPVRPPVNVKVYIGGGDNTPGAFDGYISDSANWRYVRQYADGYYINNFALNTNTADAAQNKRITTMASLFTKKNIFYETDLTRTDDLSDKVKIDILIANGFKVTFTTCNRGINDSRLAALKWRDTSRIVLGMGAPWLVGGDINSSKGIAWRNVIASTNGSSTDGPLGLWKTNQGNIQEGSISGVKYAHANGKLAMVMMAPYLTGSGAEFLKQGKLCVQQHENAGAQPDIWVISYYAAQIEQYPVGPEKLNEVTAAGTVTGLAYWLIKHLRGETVVMLDGKANNAVQNNFAEVKIPLQKDGRAACDIPFSLVNKDETGMDVCPVLRAGTNDQRSKWNISFKLNGKDVSNEIIKKDGLICVNQLRLHSGEKHKLVMHLASKEKINVATDQPLEVKLDVLSHPWNRNHISSQLTIKTKVV